MPEIGRCTNERTHNLQMFQRNNLNGDWGGTYLALQTETEAYDTNIDDSESIDWT